MSIVIIQNKIFYIGLSKLIDDSGKGIKDFQTAESLARYVKNNSLA